MSNIEWLDLEYEDCLVVSLRAVLLLVEGDEIWFPRSQIDEEEPFEPGCGPGTLRITKWIAEKKELA